MTYAQTSVGDFADDPDKSMAAANEAYLKKDNDKAAEYIHKAAAYFHKESDEVASSGKKYMKEAGDGLDKLGEDVKKGAVKSDDDLKKAFAKADHLSAKAWRETMAASQKAGKDATEAFKKAGTSLEGAAYSSYAAPHCVYTATPPTPCECNCN
jgi:hypothetical protein